MHRLVVTHINSDVVSYFNKLGSTAMCESNKPRQGEYLRLFLMLKTLTMSVSGRQSSNTVELHIRRSKLMWQSSSSYLSGLKGYSLVEVDYMLELFCSELN